MKLRSPYMIENSYQDQPYHSLILICPYCDFSCEGCQNKPLQEQPIRDFSVDELVGLIKDNPFLEGITLAGLEFCFSGDEFLDDLVELCNKAKIDNLTIYTRFTVKHPYITKALELLPVSNIYLKEGLYIKNAPNKVCNINSWSITLASDNQKFAKVKENALNKR